MTTVELRRLTILVVDDELTWLDIYSRRLTGFGYRVLTTDRPLEALRIIKEESINVALIDLRMFFPSSDEEFGGLELLKRLSDTEPELPVIVISAHGSIERGMDITMRRGAFDFVEKPVDWIRLQSIIQRADMTRSQHLSELQKKDRAPRQSRPSGVATADGEQPLVFLCHNSQSKPAVKRIARRLSARGLRPWLDEWELRPGLPWRRELEQHIKLAAAAVVFVDASGIGAWQDQEIDALLRQCLQRSCPVIPAILPGCPNLPELPPFLANLAWVDFRRRRPNPIDHLLFGITGKQF